MILADRIRKHVLDTRITPARKRGQTSVRIVAGEIHSEMGLENRMPAVCGALDADKFLSYAKVILVKRSGPRQGATAEWVFELRDTQ